MNAVGYARGRLLTLCTVVCPEARGLEHDTLPSNEVSAVVSGTRQHRQSYSCLALNRSYLSVPGGAAYLRPTMRFKVLSHNV